MKVQNKILIVDDEQIILLYIQELLKESGDYIIETAESGEEALEILPVFKPDLILLDIQLPEMDGYAVCRFIRSDDQYRFIKIIMISGNASVNERLKGYESGADDYIGKPFDNEELLAKVRVFAQLKNKEEVDQVKGDLLTLITHETRTPVSGIIGCAELLAHDPSLSEEGKELATLIAKSGQQLFQFMKNAVLLCKLKAGLEIHFNPEPVNVMLANVINGLVENHLDDEIVVDTDFDDNLVLQADWPLLINVFRFVIDNAYKFSPKNGRISIRSWSEDDMLLVTVKDEGEGVDSGLRDQIFDEFAIKDVAHHQKGQGISLAICRYILNYHHGSIHVEGEPGSGATFVIKVPLTPIEGISSH
ncbi:MAG: hybrid sensor histidine kinase/response regulator [Desulfobulbaceae bacterium]|nr:hybrid sensor histidine kinase/response regulator [Desulfobulbaceae bacterium]